MAAFTVGLLWALLFVFVARRFSLRVEHTLYVGLVTIIAAIYVGLAWWNEPAPPWLGIQIVGLLLYAGAAWFGLRRAPHVLGVAILIHAVWDLGHLLALRFEALDASFLPPHYEILCIGFDLLAGVYALARAKDWVVAMPNTR